MKEENRSRSTCQFSTLGEQRRTKSTIDNY